MTGNGYSDPAEIAAAVRQASLAIVRSQLKPAAGAAYGQVRRQRLAPVFQAGNGFTSDAERSKEELGRNLIGAAGEAAREVLAGFICANGEFYYGAVDSIRVADVLPPYIEPRRIFGL